MEQTLCNSCILGTMSLPHIYSYICIFINIFVYLYIFIFFYLYISIYFIFSLWGSVLLSCRGARRVHDTVPRPSGNFLHQVFLTILNLYFRFECNNNSMISACPSCTTPSRGGGFATVDMETGTSINIVNQKPIKKSTSYYPDESLFPTFIEILTTTNRWRMMTT